MQMVVDRYRSTKWFTSKVDKAWDGNCTWLFNPITLCSAKPPPQNWLKTNSLGATLDQITYGHDCRLLKIYSKSQILFTSKDYKAWDMNRTWHFQATTTISVKLTPSFHQKRAAPGLIWPKSRVGTVVDCFRSTPKSTLAHEEGL